MIGTIFVLLGLLVVASVIVALIVNGKRKEVERALKEAQISDSLTRIAKRHDSLARLEALDKKREADSAKVVADSARTVADSAEAEALVQKAIALVQKDSADNARAEAVKQKENALQQKEISKNQTLKIAANEYARLIREGPSAGNNNYKEFYDDDYLLAYRYHFDNLGKLVASEDEAAYQSLANKLYYNNDLYQRAYEDCKEKNSLTTVIRMDNSVMGNGIAKPFGNGFVSLADNALKLSGSGEDNYSDPLNKGQKLTALAVSRRQHLIFAAATNNFIYVFNERLSKVDSIAMGTRVTALDFNDEKSLVYFGTAIGYIGYIKYSSDRKNQPVFENKLETDVTAIQFFTHNGEPFLLATSRRSSPKVYKLENNPPMPDNRLIGNELPYQKSYGDIVGAEYLPDVDRIRLVTVAKSTRTYLWNPFTKELLDQLTDKEQFHRGTSKTDTLIKKTQIYLEQ